MRPSDTSLLPVGYRLRADLVACVAGVLSLPISAVINKAPLGSTNLGVLLLTIALATAAGIACVLANADATGTRHLFFLVRASARAAALAALLAAAMTILAARLFVSQGAALVKWIPALLSILPAAFCGMVAGALAAGVRLPTLPKNDLASTDSSQGRWPVIAILAVLCAAGFLSALVPQRRSQITSALTPSRSLISWKYQKPAQLTSAAAARWHLLATRPLGRIAPGSPLAISTTGDLLACVDADQSNVLKIIDLNKPDRFWSFPINQPLQSIAFSLDAHRVIFETSANPRRLGVVDLNTSRLLFLPKPKGNTIPEGELAWFSDTEVAFQSSRPTVAILDLDSLELTDSNSSQAWGNLSATDRGRLASSAKIDLPTNAHSSFEFHPAVAATEVPNDLQKKEWQMNGNTSVSLKDTDYDYRHFFEINVQPGDRFLAAPDGSKLIRARQNEAVIAYFTLRDAPAVTFTLSMPKSPEQHGYSATSALTAGELCAFAYSPLLNPLNQKVIGPDRDRVKGIVRFISWSGNEATMSLAEEFFPLEKNDIIADLHAWRRNRSELIISSEPRRWWSPIGSIAETQRDIAKLPASTGTKPIEHMSNYTLATESGSLVVKNIDFQPFVPEPPPVRQPNPQPTPLSSALISPAPTAVAPNPWATPSQVAPGFPRTLEPNDPTYQAVTAFVAAHHTAASRGDLNALINDYADQVVYFRNGVVDRSFIYRDEAKSRASYRRMSEAVIYPILIQELSPQHFMAQYQIAYEWIKRNNQRDTGTTNVFLFITPTPNGLRIVSQQSRLESGE